jgi:hypothetical protein
MQTYTSHFAMQPGMHPEMMQASGEPSRSGEGLSQDIRPHP